MLRIHVGASHHSEPSTSLSHRLTRWKTEISDMALNVVQLRKTEIRNRRTQRGTLMGKQGRRQESHTRTGESLASLFAPPWISRATSAAFPWIAAVINCARVSQWRRRVVVVVLRENQSVYVRLKERNVPKIADNICDTGSSLQNTRLPTRGHATVFQRAG